jgi:hypothetical protein
LPENIFPERVIMGFKKELLTGDNTGYLAIKETAQKYQIVADMMGIRKRAFPAGKMVERRVCRKP